MKTLIALGILMLVVAEGAFAQTAKTSSLAGLSTQLSMNVFRRFGGCGEDDRVLRRCARFQSIRRRCACPAADR